MSPRGPRAFVVVLDGCGMGELPDAAGYGDAGSHTLRHVAQLAGGLRVPHLQGLGLGNIDELEGVAPVARPALHGRLHAVGHGKDSMSGHWELMGCPAPRPELFPGGFPADLVAAIEGATGHRFCANRPMDGIAAIAEHGEHHLATGELILYTSADPVLQVAAHHDVISEHDLHEVCARIREVVGVRVGRVIARPFRGSPGAFERTAGRKDMTLPPPAPTTLDVLSDRGVPVHAVGKVDDLFAGRGIAHSHPGAGNEQALATLDHLLADMPGPALVFANLVDTDQVWGHRKDPHGFHEALREIDAHVGRWLAGMQEDDRLVLTSDHGVDPTMDHSDHTREHALLLATGGSERRDGPMGLVGDLVLEHLA